MQLTVLRRKNKGTAHLSAWTKEKNPCPSPKSKTSYPVAQPVAICHYAD
jgi:hypothetical protein